MCRGKLRMATILVVDDLSANRQVLVTLLRPHGHRLIEAADGREGLAAAQVEHPDLVITDVLMPVMDGYELVRAASAGTGVVHGRVLGAHEACRVSRGADNH